MNPILLAQILQALATAAETGLRLWQQGQATLSATDAQAIHEALLKAEAATDALRPQVDQALQAAALNP
jgi:hypothetical protein